MKQMIAGLALLAAMGAQAQGFYGGGSLGLQTAHVTDGDNSATTTVIQISPEVGYEFNRTWSAGLCFAYALNHNNGYNLSIVNFYPYVRGTFARAGKVDFFGELAVGYGHQSVEEYGVDGVVAGLRPGLLLHFSERFALTARTELLTFQHYDGTSTVGFGLNGNYSVGVQFQF